MPVIDRPVHPKVKITDSHRWWCCGKSRTREPLMVQDGWTEDGRRNMVEIEDFGSLECRHDFSLTDQSCRGCEHMGTGEIYAQGMKERGK